jgi:hypothetical protein
MSSWFHQLDDANSPAEVVTIARDYLATWTPEELAHLPRDCRPGRIKSTGDIELLHVCLVEEYRRTRLSGEQLSALQRLTSFVVRAALRLARLQSEGADEDAEPPSAPPRSAAGAKR